MRVYEQSQEGYQFLREATTDDMEIIHRLEGMPMGQHWAPPRVRLFRQSDFLAEALPSDFSRLAPGVPVFSTKAVEALRGEYRPGELLPLMRGLRWPGLCRLQCDNGG